MEEARYYDAHDEGSRDFEPDGGCDGSGSAGDSECPMARAKAAGAGAGASAGAGSSTSGTAAHAAFAGTHAGSGDATAHTHAGSQCPRGARERLVASGGFAFAPEFALDQAGAPRNAAELAFAMTASAAQAAANKSSSFAAVGSGGAGPGFRAAGTRQSISSASASVASAPQAASASAGEGEVYRGLDLMHRNATAFGYRVLYYTVLAVGAKVSGHPAFKRYYEVSLRTSCITGMRHRHSTCVCCVSACTTVE